MKHIVKIEIDNKRYGIPEEVFNYIRQCWNKINELEEENKHIFANVNDDELLRSNAMNWAEKNELQKRIDKAIEYIEEKWYEKNTMDIYSVVSTGDIRIDILKILKGEE